MEKYSDLCHCIGQNVSRKNQQYKKEILTEQLSRPWSLSMVRIHVGTFSLQGESQSVTVLMHATLIHKWSMGSVLDKDIISS